MPSCEHACLITGSRCPEPSQLGVVIVIESIQRCSTKILMGDSRTDQ
jgi:hypothetical protein